MTSDMPTFIGALIGFLLTILVFTYIFGDNFFFRLVVSIFIGVAAGFALVVVVYNVLFYQVIVPLMRDPLGNIAVAVPLVLGIWLLLKISPRLSRFANPVMAFLVGIGAATIIGGSVLGTIFPQVGAASGAFNTLGSQTVSQVAAKVIQAIALLIGTITTLIYFQFGSGTRTGQRALWMDVLARIGQGFIAVTFGALFAGVYLASLAALIERLNSILDFITHLL